MKNHIFNFVNNKIFIYSIFSFSLLMWTLLGFQDSLYAKIDYLISTIILVVVGMIVIKIKYFDQSVLISLVYLELGLSVAHRSATPIHYTLYTILLIIAFIIVYIAIAKLSLYRLKSFNILVMVSLPLILLLARFTGPKTGGSYLYCGFIMIFVVLFGYVFVSAFLLTLDEDEYIAGDVRCFSKNLIFFILYNLILYGCCLLCNEFGVLLILGITSSGLLFQRCKMRLSKTFYLLASLLGSIGAILLVPHIRLRTQIWLDPIAAYKTNCAAAAESVLYLFRHIRTMGFWGIHLGALPKSYIPTLMNDHVLLLIANDYSLLLVIYVVILSILFVYTLDHASLFRCEYEQLANHCSIYIFASVFLLNISSTLGSFLTSGIGFPFISLGISVNLTFSSLLAVHCALNNIKEGGIKND